jgi:hypothetical protein
VLSREVTYVCGLLNSKNSGRDCTGLEPFIGLLGKTKDVHTRSLPVAIGDVARAAMRNARLDALRGISSQRRPQPAD